MTITVALYHSLLISRQFSLAHVSLLITISLNQIPSPIRVGVLP